jgi:hypothetical protein
MGTAPALLRASLHFLLSFQKRMNRQNTLDYFAGLLSSLLASRHVSASQRLSSCESDYHGLGLWLSLACPKTTCGSVLTNEIAEPKPNRL